MDRIDELAAMSPGVSSSRTSHRRRTDRAARAGVSVSLLFGAVVAAFVVGALAGWFSGREHLKWQFANLAVEAFGKLGEGLRSAGAERGNASPAGVGLFTVQLVEMRPGRGGYDVTLRLTNTTGRDVRSAEVGVFVLDAGGGLIEPGLRLDVTTPLPAAHARIDSGVWNMPAPAVASLQTGGRIVARPRRVVYQDGTIFER